MLVCSVYYNIISAYTTVYRGLSLLLWWRESGKCSLEMLRLAPFLTVDFLEVSLSKIWGLYVKKKHVRLELSIPMERSLDYHTRVIRGHKKRWLHTDCPSCVHLLVFWYSGYGKVILREHERLQNSNIHVKS